MGLLERLVTESDGSTDSPYVCRDCEESYAERRQVCPTCGGFSVERIDW